MTNENEVVTDYDRVISVHKDPHGRVLAVRDTDTGLGSLAILSLEECLRVAELLTAPPALKVGDVLVQQADYDSVVIHVLPDVVVSRDTDDGSFRAFSPEEALSMRDGIGGAR